MHTRQYFVYIMANKGNSVLYTGVTNNLKRRVLEHRMQQGSEFTKKYRVSKLVYYEVAEDAYGAISREKQIKAGSRAKKVHLKNQFNKS